MYILLVDDDPLLRTIMTDILVEAGHWVLQANNGLTALHLLQHHPSIDVIVSDMQMPSMDGNSLLQEVKRRFPIMPFVLLTGNVIAASNTILRTLASKVLLKPIRKQQLLIALH